ncbi:diguanylate cyclase (GGDEF) domain-containing protein [Clostridium cavendishii DSM 21758]|uniref:Diguanylate cyclase (GGDEF) domain-containing protein n=1 Tax=Clostridium cavendishii DSM 21758 TaxID=1121302 RepID=A0A1M6GBB8_9CLOT|nr:GGDEF domain-containing protein [Clostridium cavendishii]SHJ07194.1 diguanylate cyclase (GGDEF) domain-containing protein [Clostridium cavendishii DSM 21758]
MRNVEIKIKGLFLILMLLIYFVFIMIYISGKVIDTKQFVTVSFILLSTVTAFLKTRINKVFIALFSTFLYGSYLFSTVLFSGAAVKIDFSSYIWLILFPIFVYVSGGLGEAINEILGKIEKLNQRKNELLRVDPVTGFKNKVELIQNLRDEMKKAKRHYFALSLMILELQYFDELQSIHSEEEINDIFFSIARVINEIARVEDMKYRIANNKFVIVLPFTDLKGSEIIRERLSNNIRNIEILNKTESARNITLTYKIGIKEYDRKVENPLDLLNLTEKELEYDV